MFSANHFQISKSRFRLAWDCAYFTFSVCSFPLSMRRCFGGCTHPLLWYTLHDLWSFADSQGAFLLARTWMQTYAVCCHRILRQHRTKHAWRLCTKSACTFSVILPKNSLPSMPASFNLTENLTAHLSHKLCAVLPWKSLHLHLRAVERLQRSRCWNLCGNRQRSA